MASTTTDQNRRLCGDILRVIFDHYAPYETLQHPLETLLLVCRDWRDAALSHGRLWANFTLHVEHGNPEEKTNDDTNEEMDEDTDEDTDENSNEDTDEDIAEDAHEDTHGFLLRRTALRLERSRMPPLDIELINLLAFEASPLFEAGYNEELPPQAAECPFCDDNGRENLCPCYTNAYKCSCQLLVLLAGRKGEHCKRWRTLTFFPTCEPHSKIEEAQITWALSYPTPLLESLTLQHVHITSLGISCLPFTPSLVQLALDSCNIPPLCGTKNLRFAAVSWDLDFWTPGYQNEAYLGETTELEVLRIGLPGDFKVALPRDLPKLRELWLSGIELPSSVRNLKMDSLHHLVIGVFDVSLISQLVGCVNEVFWQVNELTLRFLRVYNRPAFRSTMPQLFGRFTSVDTLTGDYKMLSFTMKLMWEQLSANYHITPRIFGERKIKLRGMWDDGTCVMLSPGAFPQQIVNAAVELGVFDPRKTWDDLCEMLYTPDDSDFSLY